MVMKTNNYNGVTIKELIDYVNKENKFYSLKEFENSEVFTYVSAPMLVEKQINNIDNYLYYITKIYKCEDGFVGVTGVDVIYSDMNAEDFGEVCNAEEYSQIPSTKYIPKSSIESVSFASNKPTQKQIDYITSIEEELGVIFKGKTKQEAREWLSKYAPIYENQIESEFDANYDTSNAMDRI